MRKSLIPALAILWLTSIQGAWAEDLLDIYNLARANDPIYQAAVFRDEANRYELPLAESAFKPSVTTGAQLGKQYSDISGSSETSDDHGFNLNFNLPLYDRVNRTEIEQAEKFVGVSELELLDAEQNLILRVAERYFSVLAVTDALEVARLEKIAIKRQMDLAEERLEVGLGTRTDLYDARARYKQAEADELRTKKRIDNELALLKQIIGITPDFLSPLRDDAPLDPPNPNEIDTWIQRSEIRNIRYLIDELNLGIALDEIERQKNVRSPVFSVDSNYNWIDSDRSFTGSGGSYDSADISVQLRFPLYLGGTVDLRTEQAGQLYNQVERQLEESKRAASTQATSAFLDINSQISEVGALFDAITAGESALEAKEEGFDAGLTTNLDVLDAQRDLSQSRTDYLRARYNYILSVLQLEASAGDLNQDDIERVNGWLK